MNRSNRIDMDYMRRSVTNVKLMLDYLLVVWCGDDVNRFIQLMKWLSAVRYHRETYPIIVRTMGRRTNMMIEFLVDHVFRGDATEHKCSSDALHTAGSRADRQYYACEGLRIIHMSTYDIDGVFNRIEYRPGNCNNTLFVMKSCNHRCIKRDLPLDTVILDVFGTDQSYCNKYCAYVERLVLQCSVMSTASSFHSILMDIDDMSDQQIVQTLLPAYIKMTISSSLIVTHRNDKYTVLMDQFSNEHHTIDMHIIDTHLCMMWLDDYCWDQDQPRVQLSSRNTFTEVTIRSEKYGKYVIMLDRACIHPVSTILMTKIDSSHTTIYKIPRNPINVALYGPASMLTNCLVSMRALQLHVPSDVVAFTLELMCCVMYDDPDSYCQSIYDGVLGRWYWRESGDYDQESDTDDCVDGYDDNERNDNIDNDVDDINSDDDIDSEHYSKLW